MANCVAQEPTATSVTSGGERFKIKDDQFWLDGEALRIVSCGIHYHRIPREYWADRLERVKGLGCNAIEFYVPWNFHEPAPGVFDFEGERDVEAFVELASSLDLHVCLRPGPYICGEWDAGGFPAWLLDPQVVGKSLLGYLRTEDEVYMHYVDLYWAELLPRFKRFMAHNGGPILMAQIENEFGYWNVGGKTEYLQKLRELALKHLGDDTVLFSTDNPWFANKGGLPETYTVVDFGPGTNVNTAFKKQAEDNEPGMSPPFCSEYYTGWLTHWGEAMANTSAQAVAKTLRQILAYNNNTGSVNFYMAHGGTSFGFWAGTNGNLPDITSYDYDAPVSEAGGTGQPGIGGENKYKVLQAVVCDARGVPRADLPKDPKTAAYGTVALTQSATLLDNLAQLHFDDEPFVTEHPVHMEALGMAFGIVVYSTQVPCSVLNGATLHLTAYDLAQVLVDGKLVGTLWRAARPSIVLPPDACNPTADSEGAPDKNSTLTIVVSAYGRDNFYASGSISTLYKGVIGPVQIQPPKPKTWFKTPTISGENITVPTSWTTHALPLVQPGRVLKWSQEDPGEADAGSAEDPTAVTPIATTQTVLSGAERLSFDSLRGGVWRSAGILAAAPRAQGLGQPGDLPDDSYFGQWVDYFGQLWAMFVRVRNRALGQPSTEQDAWEGVFGSADMTKLLAPKRRKPAADIVNMKLVMGPVFYRGLFNVEPTCTDAGSGIADTFLRTDGFQRGMAWVNGHNLGRYFNDAGPQMTLYVPGVWLKEGENELVLLELEAAPVQEQAEFVAEPDFHGP